MNSEDTCAHRELLSLRVLLAFSTVILGKVENEYILRFHSTVSNDIAKQALIDTEVPDFGCTYYYNSIVTLAIFMFKTFNRYKI